MKLVRVYTADGEHYRGTMPAQVGMVTTDGGTVVRVNERSVVVIDPARFSGSLRITDTQNITITEARKFGWPGTASRLADQSR